MFLKRIIIFFLFFLINSEISAETKTFYVRAKETESLCSYLSVFVDSTKSLSIKDVASNQYEQKFIDYSEDIIRIPFVDATYWYKCKLKNIAETYKSIIIEFRNSTIDKIQLFTQHYNIVYPTQQTGDQFPFNTRSVKSRNFAFELSLKPYEEYVLYIKIENGGDALNIPVNVFTPTDYSIHVQNENYIYGLFYGIVFTVFFTNLLFLIILRVKKEIYINYVLYILIFGLFCFTFDGLTFQYFFPNSPSLANNLLVILALLSIPPVLHFASEYLEYKRFKPLFNRITYFLLVPALILAILSFFPLPYPIKVIPAHLLSNISLLFIIFTAIYLYKENPKLNLVFLLSFLVMSLSNLLLSSNILSGIFDYYFREYSMKVGFSVQSVLLTVALSLRLKIQQDNIRFEAVSNLIKLNTLKEQQTRELELKIEERTRELVEKNQLLEKLSFVAEQTDNCVMIFDKDGNLEWANQSLERILGYTLEEYIATFGNNIKKFSKNPQISNLLDKAIFLRESIQYESYETKKNGEKIWFLTTITPIFDNQNRFYKFVSIDSDITKLKQAEEQIKQQKAELEEANRKIVEASKLKEIFLANTSHEIRTPLNAIVGYANLLSKEKVGNLITKKFMDYIKNIKISGDNLLIIINDILDFSKIEAGKLDFESVEFNLIEQGQSVISTMNIKAVEKKIKLTHRYAKDLPSIVIGDPHRLSQILINLVGNAIKFTPEGGLVSLEINLKSKNEEEAVIEFVVSDNGIGIAPDKKEKIFESFVQGEDDISRRYGGTGLGLTIVKRLVELQKGEIILNSTLGLGTTFKIYLPYKISKKKSLQKISKDIDHKTRCKKENVEILLVEDNEINKQIFIDTVKAEYPEVKIDVAENGYKAFDMALAKNYSIVFMDLQMPGMNGIETTQLFRKELPESKRNVPIIAITADAFSAERERCLQSGMQSFISKPFNPELLYLHLEIFSCENARKIVKESGFEIAKEVCRNCPKRIEKEQEVEVISAQSDFQVINLDVISKIYKDNKDKIKNILRMYYDSIPGEIEKLQNSINEMDKAAIKQHAHSLKTKMLYIGLKYASDLCKQIENYSTEDKPDRNPIINSMLGIKAEWQKAIPEIERFLNE